MSKEAAKESALSAREIAESQLRHAAEVAKDNGEFNRAKFFEDLANEVFWKCPVD